MQRYETTGFSPGLTFKCAKPFVMSGVAYAPGDVVDKTGVEDRRLRQMFDLRMIVPVQGVAVAVKPKAPAKAPESPTAADQPVAAAQVAAGSRAVHKGFGRWYVVNAKGDTTAGPFTKSEAEAAVAA